MDRDRQAVRTTAVREAGAGTTGTVMPVWGAGFRKQRSRCILYRNIRTLEGLSHAGTRGHLG